MALAAAKVNVADAESSPLAALPVADEVTLPGSDLARSEESELPRQAKLLADALRDDEDAAEEEAAEPHAVPQSCDADDVERWQGTMTRDWAADAARPAPTSAPQRVAKSRKVAKPRISLPEALHQIPPEAIDFLRDTFKTTVNALVSREPSPAAKDRVAKKQRDSEAVEDIQPETPED